MNISAAIAKRVLIIDSTEAGTFLALSLERNGFITEKVGCGKQAIARLQQESFNVVLLENRLPDIEALEVLEQVRRYDESIPVILITGNPSMQDAVRAAKAGAFDYLVRPFEGADVLLALRNALEPRNTGGYGSRGGATTSHDLKECMGRSDAIKTLAAEVERVAETGFFVLITGETGTGKNLAARAIHAGSGRAQAEFVAIDCGAIPESLIESELFGHEKGAFTGAHQAMQGAFEAASGGTLFLDEIGNLPLSVQGKLLRALEDRQIHRLGSAKNRHLDLRVVAATNVDIRKMMKEQTFRADLYHRLAEFTIVVPSLRERKGDLEYLVNRFVRLTGQELRKEVCRLSSEAWQAIYAYDWPGNVRELRNALRRAVLCADDHGTIGPEHLEIPTQAQARRSGLMECPENVLAPQADAISLKEHVRRAVAVVEREYLVRALELSKGNKAEAARLLKIDYKTIHMKIKEYNIQLHPQVQSAKALNFLGEHHG